MSLFTSQPLNSVEMLKNRCFFPFTFNRERERQRKDYISQHAGLRKCVRNVVRAEKTELNVSFASVSGFIKAHAI